MEMISVVRDGGGKKLTCSVTGEKENIFEWPKVGLEVSETVLDFVSFSSR